MSSKGTVLMLPMSLDIGGAETHLISLAKGIKSLGWEVSVASNGGKRVRDLLEAGIPHFEAPLHSRSPLKMIRAQKIVSRLLSAGGIDLIHAHARIPIWISERLSSRYNIPLAATYHYPFKSGFPWTFFSRQGQRTIAVSQVIKDYIVKEFGFDPERITVIPNGIDVTLFHPVDLDLKRSTRDKLNIPPNKGPVLMYSSRLDDSLSDTAITAQETVLELSKKYPEIMMLIAGDGKNAQAVRTKAEEINRSCGKEVVRYLGFVLDTPSLYAVSDIIIGMSRVALEAMSCGKPAVIFGPGGTFGPASPKNFDVLEERNYVSLNAPLPPTSAHLADFLDDLIKNPDKREELGRYGRKVVADCHSEESVARATEAVYLELLKKR